MKEETMRATNGQELLQKAISWKQAVFGAVMVGVANGIGAFVLSLAAQFRYEPSMNLHDDLLLFGVTTVLFPLALYLFCMKGLVQVDRVILWCYRVRGVQFGADRPLPYFIRGRNAVRFSGYDEFLATLAVIYAVMHAAQRMYDDYTTTTGQAILLFGAGYLTAFWISELTKRTLGKQYKWYKLLKDFDDPPPPPRAEPHAE